MEFWNLDIVAIRDVDICLKCSDYKIMKEDHNTFVSWDDRSIFYRKDLEGNQFWPQLDMLVNLKAYQVMGNSHTLYPIICALCSHAILDHLVMYKPSDGNGDQNSQERPRVAATNTMNIVDYPEAGYQIE